MPQLQGFTTADLIALRIGMQVAICFYDDRKTALGLTNTARLQGLIGQIDAMLGRDVVNAIGAAMPPPGGQPVLVLLEPSETRQ